VAELAIRERTEENIERLRDVEDRLGRRAASMEKHVAVLTERVDRMRKEVAQHVALMAFEGRLQQVTDVVTNLHGNAYGETGSPWSTTNLLLAGNQLFWTLLDPVLAQAGMTKSGRFTVSLLTPFASLLTGELLVGNRQHERFISGISTADATGVIREALRGKVAEGAWEHFQTLTNLPVVVERPPGYHTRGEVNGGVLTIRVFGRGNGLGKGFTNPTAGVRVGWIVDTRLVSG